MLSLGTYPDVTLSKARERRDDARRLLADGIDPGENRKSKKQPDKMPRQIPSQCCAMSGCNHVKVRLLKPR
jgi:hypothetical protein